MAPYVCSGQLPRQSSFEVPPALVPYFPLGHAPVHTVPAPLRNDPASHFSQLAVAPVRQPGEQTALHTLRTESHNNPAPQSARLSAHTAVASSPAVVQQQRRAMPPPDAAHVAVDAELVEHWSLKGWWYGGKRELEAAVE